MNRPLSLITLLLMGLMVGCAPTASGEAGAVGLGQTPVASVDTPTSAPTATPQPTNTATVAPTSTPEPSLTIELAPTETATTVPVVASTYTSTAMPSATPALSQDSSDLEEVVSYGLEVYHQQYCGVCHQLSAADTAGMFGPTHDGMGSIAEQRIQAPGYAGSATTAGEYIRESIISPDAYLVPGYEVTSHHMPTYAHLEEGDIDALVQMLLYQE